MEKDKNKKADDTDDEEVDDKDDEEVDDTDDEDEPSKPDPESREDKVKKRVAFARRKAGELERLVGMEVDIEDIKAKPAETSRELNIERAMKKFDLSEEAAGLLPGSTKEEIFRAAKKLRGMLDKTAKGKSETPDDDGDSDDKGKSGDGEKKKRIKGNPDLKDADELDDGDKRPQTEKAIKKRYDEACEKLGW